jgi:photosynthetic reaction center H subunit
MFNPEFFGNFDVTSLLLTTFVLFFLGVIIYLRREDRREGYPLEDEVSGRLEESGGLFFAARPKTFHLGPGQEPVFKPDNLRDSQDLTARRTSRVFGSPFEPVGNPLTAGVGPGAFALRSRQPEMMFHGGPKIVPLRVATDFSVDPKTADPLGMKVVGADGVVGGIVSDVWLDRSEFIARYLEVAVTPIEGAGPVAIRHVLVPMAMVVVKKAERLVRVDPVLGSQIGGAPVLSNPDQITIDEEERITAYFGAGYLYATAERSEPLL